MGDGVSEWSGAVRGLNCVPPAKKKGIRSGLPLLLRIMGLRVHFPSGSPRGRTQRKPQPRLFYPESNPAPYDDLLLGADCGPSCSPKDQQLYSFSFVFQPKTRQQTNKLGAESDAVAENESDPSWLAIREPASPSALSNTNQPTTI